MQVIYVITHQGRFAYKFIFTGLGTASPSTLLYSPLAMRSLLAVSVLLCWFSSAFGSALTEEDLKAIVEKAAQELEQEQAIVSPRKKRSLEEQAKSRRGRKWTAR